MAFSTFPNNPFPPSSAQFDDVNTELATKTNLSNIAPAFDATSGVYAVGDKVIYNGVLYEFTSAHSTAGEWDESEVQPVKISELIDSLKSGLTNLLLRKTIIVGDITIPSDKNYYQISSQVIDPPTGYTAIAVNIYDWTSAPTPISATFTRGALDSIYIMGASSTVITGLKIEVIFVKSDMISVAT